MITQQHLKSIFNYNPETGVFTRAVKRKRYDIGTTVGSKMPSGYMRTRIDGKDFYLHRLAWLYVHGCWPSEIDHINRDKSDNRIKNLRDVTRSENGLNTGIRKTNTSGFTGVSKFRNKWRAYRDLNGKRTYLGMYDTPQEAAQARNA